MGIDAIGNMVYIADFDGELTVLKYAK